MVYDPSNKSVTVPANPMLGRAIKRLGRDAERIMAREFAWQLRRGGH